MSHELADNELQALKDQFEELRERASRSDDVEKLFDAEIRRRFGLMIYHAIDAASQKSH